MTCNKDAAAPAVDALERIETTDDLWGALASVAAGYGFDKIVAYRLATDDAQAHVVYANAPADVVTSLERHGFIALAASFTGAGRPVLVSEHPTPQLTAEQTRLVDYAQQNLGTSDVMLLPVRGNDALIGFVALAGARPALPPIVRSSLHLLAHIAFLGGDAKPPRRSALSPREAECLHLAAQGNTDTAIGRLLSISPRTARFHIENAKKKLGVTTRTQAVAEALRLNAFAA